MPKTFVLFQKNDPAPTWHRDVYFCRLRVATAMTEIWNSIADGRSGWARMGEGITKLHQPGLVKMGTDNIVPKGESPRSTPQ